jgi:hypothetical protein
MTLVERIAEVRAMRQDIDELRDVMPPEEWAALDAQLRRVEARYAEIAAVARYAVEKFERPELWTRELEDIAQDDVG